MKINFHNLTISLLSVIIIISCSDSPKKQSNPNQENAQPMHFNINEALTTSTKISKLSSIAKEIEYIPLETNPMTQNLRPSIIKICDEGLIINDSRKGILMFSKSGKLSWLIDKNVPVLEEEITFSPFFDFDQNNKEIYIPTGTKTILVYDFSGSLKKCIESEVPVFDINAFENGYFIIGNFNVPSLGTIYRIIEQNGRIVTSLDKHSIGVENDLPYYGSVKCPDGAIVTIRDTIWLIRDDLAFKSIITLDRLKDTISDEKYSIRTFCFGKNLIGITVFVANRTFLIDYVSNKYYIVGDTDGKLMDDLDSGTSINPYFNQYGYAIRDISPKDLLNDNIITQESPLDSIRKLVQLDDNQIIQIIKLKENISINP
jgi:hypothetical protein